MSIFFSVPVFWDLLETAVWFLTSISQVRTHSNKNHSYQDGKIINISLIQFFIFILFIFLISRDSAGLREFIRSYEKTPEDFGPRNS